MLFYSYNDSTDMYTILHIRNPDRTAEEEAGFSDDSASGDPNTQLASISLTSRRWQLYVDLQGRTEADIEKLVFSIPKRQRSSTPSETSSPLESNGERMVSSPSLPALNRNWSNGTTHSSRERSRLLIKVQKMDRAKERIERTIKAYTKAPVTLEFTLPSPDHGGRWFFVETRCNDITKWANSIARALGDSAQVIVAGKQEHDKFKRYSVYCQRNKTQQLEDEVATSRAKEEATVATPRTKKGLYTHGIRLNWVVKKDILEQSPLRNSGVSSRADADLRRDAGKWIERLIKALAANVGTMQLGRDEKFQAMQILHRFMVTSKLDVNRMQAYSAASLFVVLKCNGHEFKLTEYLLEAAKELNTSSLDINSQAFQRWSRVVSCSISYF